jgi:antitoxin YefM
MKTTITATAARSSLYKLIEQTHSTHVPVTVTGKKNNAVIVSEEDWNAIQETLYLTSIPGMRESIKAGMASELNECVEGLKW